MNIDKRKCLVDFTCNECGTKLKKDIDNRIAIVTKNKSLILCKTCYTELTVQVCLTDI